MRVSCKNSRVIDHEIEDGVSALLAFRGANVRSFRDEFELSLLATSLSEKDVVREIPWRKGGKPVGVLPVAGLFGANASGKSGLLKAMSDMRNHVLNSFRYGNPTGGISRRPFLLKSESRIEPSHFEVDMVLNGIRYGYGFVLNDELILEEWAYRYPNGKPALLFRRSGMKIELGASDRAKGRLVTELLRPNALFLSTAASANNPTLLPLYEWFRRCPRALTA